MAPTDVTPRVVGVDVTAHKEARHITDVKKARRQSNTRVRYYVELVVGSPRASHTRLGFSGTFKALLRLHGAFEALFNAKHAPVKTHSSRESVSSATSASSASSSASASQRRRASVETDVTPKILAFPTHHALLVKLQPRQHVESDAKASARCDALFVYYSQLFNSDERELYLAYIQTHAEKAQETASTGNNQSDHVSEEAVVSEKRGFLKKLFGLRRQDDGSGGVTERTRGENGRERAAVLDAKLEFAAPVHVTVKKNRRRM